MTSWYDFLLPDFTWKNDIQARSIKSIPPTPQPAHPRLRQFWGMLHTWLRRFSRTYCGWVGITYDNQIAQLPFGLILKWSDGTRLEEVLAMQVARAAGIPVPRVICYGEHPDTPHAPVSILMTRVAGKELGQLYESLSREEQESIFNELKGYLEVMRGWQSPWGENRICSIIGTPIRSVRVPRHLVGPFESEQEFNDYLIAPAWAGGFQSQDVYEEKLNIARGMAKLQHRIVFTHGDLQSHNIMVDRGRITGFIDWESAGWCPEYWDFTTALRFTPQDFWWYKFVLELGGDAYLAELECERALISLTRASYTG